MIHYVKSKMTKAIPNINSTNGSKYFGGLIGVPLAQYCLRLLKDIIHVCQDMLHNCTAYNCYMCSFFTSWYQLAQELIAFFLLLYSAVIKECF